MSENSITAYRISQETGISESGLGKIFDGAVKNPQKRTLQAITEYLISVGNGGVPQEKKDDSGIDGIKARLFAATATGKTYDGMFEDIDILIGENDKLAGKLERLYQTVQGMGFKFPWSKRK